VLGTDIIQLKMAAEKIAVVAVATTATTQSTIKQ